MATQEQFADLVFEGGGVKGIGFAGALTALEERGYTAKNVAGTSAGAITAALVAAGYSAGELNGVLTGIPFQKFRDKGFEDHLPGGAVLSVLSQLGIYEGEFFRTWMRDLLAEKGVVRFGDLLNPDALDPQDTDQRWRLRVIASDVTNRRMLILPRDAKHFGVEPDELEVADAVRMSMSIPIFFEPVIRPTSQGKARLVIVDGGMLSNFPVWLFDRKDGKPPRWPTLGLLLMEPDPRTAIGEQVEHESDEAERGSIIDFVKSLAMTMMAAHDRLYLDSAEFARTIPIPTLGVGTTEFDITPQRVEALRASGYDATVEFLDEWDPDEHFARYREGGS
jgi:NTE family protein